MIKNLTGGSTINYGPTLPAAEASFDGTMFYKTTGTDQGLYVFGFVQDSSTTLFGDQSTQGWTQVQTPGLYVSKLGDIVNGQLSIVGVGASSDPYGRLAVTMPADTNNYAYLGFTRQGHIGWTMGVDTSDRLFFGSGGGGSTSNVTSRPMTLDSQGNLLINGNPVWNAGNDGVGSALDAGLLGGQAPSFYTTADNISSGTLNVARLPFTPVKQGTTNNVTISWTGSQLGLQVDSTGFGTTWPMSITGSSATANFANSATNATNATEATSARYLHSGAAAAGTAMAFTWSDPGGAPAYLWGGNAVGSSQVYQPINLTVGVARNADQAAALNNFLIGGRTAADWNTYRTSGFYGAEGSPANSVGGYASVIVAANSDVGLQIAGGYTNDSLWFRGWNSSGAAFSTWRSVVHSGNIASQSVNYANSANTANSATTAGTANSANTASVATRIVDSATLYGNTISTGRLLFNNITGSAAAPLVTIYDSDTGIYSGGDGLLMFSSNGAYAAQISPGGNFTAVGNVTAYSDRRIKDNIVTIPNALEKVKGLTGVTYTRKDNGEAGTGLIAQDVQAVLPEAVQEQAFDGMLTVAYGNLVGLLVESIKELNLKVDSMAQELAELKGK